MAKRPKTPRTSPSGQPVSHEHWLPILLGLGVLMVVVGGIAHYSYPDASIPAILLHVLLGVLWVAWIVGPIVCLVNIIKNIVERTGRGFLWIVITILYLVVVIGGGIQLLDALTGR